MNCSAVMKKILIIPLIYFMFFLVSCQTVNLPELPASGNDISSITDCILTNYENQSMDYCTYEEIEDLVIPYVTSLIDVEDISVYELSITSAVRSMYLGSDMDNQQFYFDLMVLFDSETETISLELYNKFELAFLQMSNEILNDVEHAIQIGLMVKFDDNGASFLKKANYSDKNYNIISRSLNFSVIDKDELQVIEDSISTYQDSQYAQYFGENTYYGYTSKSDGYILSYGIWVSSVDEGYRLEIGSNTELADNVRAVLETVLPGYKEITLDIYK